jgi:hypothetical protein
LISNEGSIALCLEICDPLAQDCDPGLGCYWANNEFYCLETTQDILLGEPCETIDSCLPGLACLPAEVLPDCMGSDCCASFCSVAVPECPQPGTECADFFEMGMAPPGYEDIGVCVIPGA